MVGEAALLVPSGDAAALERAVRRVLDDRRSPAGSPRQPPSGPRGCRPTRTQSTNSRSVYARVTSSTTSITSRYGEGKRFGYSQGPGGEYSFAAVSSSRPVHLRPRYCRSAPMRAGGRDLRAPLLPPEECSCECHPLGLGAHPAGCSWSSSSSTCGWSTVASRASLDCRQAGHWVGVLRRPGRRCSASGCGVFAGGLGGGVLRRLHHRVLAVGRQPVRLRHHHGRVRGAGGAPAPGAAGRHRDRPGHARRVHRASAPPPSRRSAGCSTSSRRC